MNPYRIARMRALLVWLPIAGLGFAPGTDTDDAPTLPKDACALLKPAEIQAALAPTTTIGAGVANTSTLPIAVGCTYTWGPRTSEWGETQLTLTVIDATKGWPGMDPALIEEGIHTKVRAGGEDASNVNGVGEAAAFTIETRSNNATAEAYFESKAEHLSLTLHEGNPRSKKDKIVALLKQAAARL